MPKDRAARHACLGAARARSGRRLIDDRAAGDAAAEQRVLREAHRLYVEMGIPSHAARVEGMLSPA